MSSRTLPDGSAQVDFGPPGASYHPPDRLTLTLEMTPEDYGALNQLAHDTGQNINGVIQSALGMYKVAVDAHKQGRPVGIGEESAVMETRFF